MHPFRTLTKSPAFTTVAILTVALGLASSTAIFSVANGVLFRPLPFRDEAGLSWIWSTRPDRDRAFFSIPNFLDLQRQNTTTADLAAITPLSFSVTGLGEPERAVGWRVTANLFSILGIEPHAGTMPAISENPAADAPVAVLGYGYWQRRFGGDPGIVGRSVILNGSPHVVVGVLPAAFVLPHWQSDILVAQSLESDARRADRGTHFLRGIARLKPGVTREQAQAEFTALNQQLVTLHPATNSTITAPRFVPIAEEIVGGFRGSLLLLLGAAGALLLIMCANLAGLLAARGLARRRDAALCAALGASPARLLRAYLAEGLVIACSGGALGLLACVWGLDALLALAPADLPRATQIGIDGRVFAFAAVCTLLTGLGVGFAPALSLSRTAPQDVLKNGSGGATARQGARSVLVAAQIALCTTLLIGTGLLTRSLHKLLDTHPGFDRTGVLAVQVALPATTYQTVPVVVNFADEAVRRLAALPGVSSASLTSILPLAGINTRSEFTRADRPPARPSDTLSAANRFIGEDYFRTVGIPLLAGRDLRPEDNASAPAVVVIDQALARLHWPGEEPVGKTILLREGGGAPRAMEIVGVVGPTKNFSLEETGTPALYLPFRQMNAVFLPFFTPRINFVTKTAASSELREPMRRILRELDASTSVSVRSLDEVVAWARAPRTFNIRLLGFFSVSAVLLAVIGLYAITAQAVTARTREIGIRLALGADGLRIALAVLGGGLRLTLTGIAAGCALALALGPLLARMLYGIHPFDGATFAVVGLGLTAVALLATWLPARRATRVDPITALRAE